MVVSKTLNCNSEDVDTVILELAKEIRNDWHIVKIEVDPPPLSRRDRSPFTFSVTLEQKIGDYNV